MQVGSGGNCYTFKLTEITNGVLARGGHRKSSRSTDINLADGQLFDDAAGWSCMTNMTSSSFGSQAMVVSDELKSASLQVAAQRLAVDKE